MLKNGELIELSWEQGLSEIRLYYNETQSFYKPINNVTEAFKVGDIIRVINTEGGYRITQVPKIQAALVSLNPNTGAIVSLSGGFDYYHNKYNRITQAQRQPGSSIKPFLYAAALLNNYTAATLINDASIKFYDPLLEDIWRPTNYSDRYYGPTTLRRALYLSLNLVSIRILRGISIYEGIRGINKFGFKKDTLPKDLTLSLGTQSLTPLDLAKGFAVLANGGYSVEPYFIERVEDRYGTEIFSQEPVDLLVQEPAVDPRVVFIIDSILKDAVAKGTAKKARSLRRNDIAGKTGTTNGPRDNWFAGYHPDLVAVTWLGFDNNQLIGAYESGGRTALPIWIDYMSSALKNLPRKYLQQPEGIVRVRINQYTGSRTTPEDPGSVFEYFLEENLPEQQATEEIVNPNSNTDDKKIF